MDPNIPPTPIEVTPVAPPVAPAPAPVPQPAPAAPVATDDLRGKMTSGKLEIGVWVTMGVIVAGCLYSIYYQSRQLRNPSILKLRTDVDEQDRKLRKILGQPYAAA